MTAHQFPEVVIHRENAVTGKSRAFRAIYLGGARADGLWEGGAAASAKNAALRPVYAVFAGSEDEMRPFVANLVLGYEAAFVNANARYGEGDKIEFLKSAKFQVACQRGEAGTVATIYLPGLFALDPGMVDPSGAKFVLLPAAPWFEDQVAKSGVALDVDAAVDHVLGLAWVRERNRTRVRLADWYDGSQRWEERTPDLPEDVVRPLAPVAHLFCAMLDRRTRVPFVPDGRFYLQVMLACLREGLASWSRRGSYRGDREGFGCGKHGFAEEGLAACGHLPGIAFSADHESIEALLAKETTDYFESVGGGGGGKRRRR